MNLKPKAEWLAALRGNKYKQTSGCLRSEDDRFCCLGVAEDISPFTKWMKASDGDWVSMGGVDHSAIQLTRPTMEWLGLSGGYNPKLPPEAADAVKRALSQVGGSIGSPHSLYLAGLNDRGVPFAVIADLIEEYL